MTGFARSILRWAAILWLVSILVVIVLPEDMLGGNPLLVIESRIVRYVIASAGSSAINSINSRLPSGVVAPALAAPAQAPAKSANPMFSLPVILKADASPAASAPVEQAAPVRQFQAPIPQAPIVDTLPPAPTATATRAPTMVASAGNPTLSKPGSQPAATVVPQVRKAPAGPTYLIRCDAGGCSGSASGVSVAPSQGEKITYRQRLSGGLSFIWRVSGLDVAMVKITGSNCDGIGRTITWASSLKMFCGEGGWFQVESEG